MARKKEPFDPLRPLRHPDHRRPVTRRELISQGFMAGTATVLGFSPLAALMMPSKANAAIDLELSALADLCGLSGGTPPDAKIPFICFDLAGGANIAGSNVLVGGQGGQEDVLSTAGYSKLGIGSDQLPSPGGADPTTNFINEEFGLKFHNTSAMLKGMQLASTGFTSGTINGMVIPARSENDTSNNPHNPIYGIAKAGISGDLLTLIGSRTSVSGGNSMSPSFLIDSSLTPTRISSPSDAVRLVDTGNLTALLGNSSDNAARVLKAMYGLADKKLARYSESVATENQIRCAYAKSADNVNEFGNPSDLDPLQDPDISSIGGGSIFSAEDLLDSDIKKTASIMKLVVNRLAGAGTITLGGYDYHTGDRKTGEARDLIAGKCIGACLEYAKRKNTPLMVYVFSDGAVSSNGRMDTDVGKPEWTSDNQATAAAFFLVYNPSGVTSLRNQLGYMSSNADVVTSSSPAANSVTQLVNTVILNYMAINGDIGNFDALYAGLGIEHGLGSSLDSLVGVDLT